MPLKVIPRRDRKLHRLVKKGPTLYLEKGQVLFSQGEPAHDLFLVRTGHLQLVLHHETARERVVGLAGPWEMTGDEGLLTGTPRRTTALAGEASQITVLEGKGVNRALRTASRTYGAYLAAKEEELALARAQNEPRRAGGTAHHLGSLLLHLSQRLGKHHKHDEIKIPIRLTHSVLADLSGCHRSTVTTLLNDWIYRGVLEQEEGFLRILDAEGLKPG